MWYPAPRVDGAQKPVALGKVSEPGGSFCQIGLYEFRHSGA
jgi:hypothetical protein